MKSNGRKGLLLGGKKVTNAKDEIWILLSWCNRQDMMSHIPPDLSVVSLQCALKVTQGLYYGCECEKQGCVCTCEVVQVCSEIPLDFFFPLQFVELMSRRQGELDALVATGYKSALTEERRRYCFLVDRQCCVTKLLINYHSKVTYSHLHSSVTFQRSCTEILRLRCLY